MAGTTTLQTLREAVYGILNEPLTSNVYSNSLVDEYVNNAIIRLSMKKKWQFMRQKQPFIMAQETTLSEDITTATTDFDIGNATNFQADGALWVEGDVVDYTSIAANNIVGTTNIDISHNSGALVAPLYKLPSDFFREPVFLRQTTNTEVYSEVPFVHEDNWNNYKTNTSMMSSKFTIVTDKSEVMYLRVDGVSQGDRGILYYKKRPRVLSADADVCDIPDEWVLNIIPPLAAYKLMVYRGDNIDGLADRIQQEAEAELFRMEKYYGMREQGWSKLITSTYQSVHPYAYYRRRTRYE